MNAPRFTLTRSTSRAGPDRRAALALLASGAAAALSACSPPRETAVPYVIAPEGSGAGVRRRYATTLAMAGYGMGVTGVCIDGRPIKLEGNARHPASQGSTDVFAEAAILDLYDPTRLKAPVGLQGPTDWTTLGQMMRGQMAKHTVDKGAGLALVTGRVTSPSLLRQIARLQAAYPQMLWSRFEAVHDDNRRAAWGKAVTLTPRYVEADLVVWLGADPLGPGPQQIANARAIAGRRRPTGADGSQLSRLYAAEATLSQSGAMADHRLTADPATQAAILTVLSGQPSPALSARARRFAEAVAADLKAHQGRALIEVGREHPPEVHALAKVVNAGLAAPIDIGDDPDPHPEGHVASLDRLRQRLRAGQVQTLIVLDANPAFHAHDLTAPIGHVPVSLWLGSSLDETADACRWRAPLSHTLESWSDARSMNGTASLGQPLIRPLYDTRTGPQALAMLAGDDAADEKALVRETWPQLADEAGWRAALSSGVIATAPQHNAPQAESASAEPSPPAVRANQATAPSQAKLTVQFIPHPTLWDGCHADNAWLQECPDPITKEVWGSALRLSAADARRLGLHDGDHARLQANGQSIDLRVSVVRGQAPGVATLPLGGGRRIAGPIGAGVGADAALLRGSDLAWTAPVERIERLSASPTPINQASFTLDGETATLAPTLTVAGLKAKAQAKPRPPAATLLPPERKADHAWAMVIDTAVCIGCNACVTACQAENNVPVVGPEEIAAGRDMHWLRIDRYDPGMDQDDPQTVFSPTPCMQCEDAPCEPVCPVEASVHDHEGLNDQVYNRCVGTRFCQANCPYKVRRFNYRDYQSPRLYPGIDAEPLKAQKNPDVTVRARGVMEKCTYCVQRIAAAKSESERTGNPIADGTLKTACQGACPTQAITFGDLNDPAARVNAQRGEARHFTLLEEANTRPRTTYLAKVRNPNPALERRG